MRNAKVDRNQAEIVKALRDAGYSVALTHRVGAGFPDLCVGIVTRTGYSINLLLEVKAPGEKLNKREMEWHSQWRGHAVITHDSESALQICENWKAL